MSDATRSSPTTGESSPSRGSESLAEAHSGEVWPVYSGKSFNLWQPDTGDYYDSAAADEIFAHLHEKRLRQSRTKSSAFSGLTESVLEDPTTLPCRQPRIAFRDVARATDTRTIVAALIPPDRVVVHKAPYLLRKVGSACDEAYLLGLLSSMPCDWQSRRTVELVMSFEQVGQLVVPDPGEGHPVRDRVAEIAGRLAATDERFSEWAAEVGVSVGSASDAAVKQDLICELDACVAILYGLDSADLAVIYSTFDAKRPDRYADHHAAVLPHFHRWSALQGRSAAQPD